MIISITIKLKKKLQMKCNILMQYWTLMKISPSLSFLNYQKIENVTLNYNDRQEISNYDI